MQACGQNHPGQSMHQGFLLVIEPSFAVISSCSALHEPLVRAAPYTTVNHTRVIILLLSFIVPL